MAATEKSARKRKCKVELQDEIEITDPEADEVVDVLGGVPESANASVRFCGGGSRFGLRPYCSEKLHIGSGRLVKQ